LELSLSNLEAQNNKKSIFFCGKLGDEIAQCKEQIAKIEKELGTFLS